MQCGDLFKSEQARETAIFTMGTIAGIGIAGVVLGVFSLMANNHILGDVATQIPNWGAWVALGGGSGVAVIGGGGTLFFIRAGARKPKKMTPPRSYYQFVPPNTGETQPPPSRESIFLQKKSD
jgi:hypothetical protein